MSNINLTEQELTEYLAKIDKAEDFTEWLTKKRSETQTLHSLLAPASDGKGTRKGGERGEVDYAKVYKVIEEAGAAGLKLRDVCEKAGYDYASNKGRIGTNLRAAKAKADGITVNAGVFTFKAPKAKK